ncbi:MAG: Nif3-like dinuclear metal center hexameric protein [Bacteroidota bacterium]
MQLKEITRVLEAFAPPSLQESYDNSGLQVGSPEQKIRGVLISLDLTDGILQEAKAKGCNMVIVHHPLIFKGLKRLTGKGMVERLVMKAIREDIAIYAIHTNLDSVDKGVSAALAAVLGLVDTKILSPRKGLLRKLVTFCPADHTEPVREAIFKAGAGEIGNYDSCSFNIEGMGSFRAMEGSNPFVGKIGALHFEKEIRIETVYPAYLESAVLSAMLKAHPYEEVAYDIYSLENVHNQVGFGILGSLPEALDEIDFLAMLKEMTVAGCVRHTELLNKKIKKVALCGGSGSFLIKEAIQAGADVFVAADMKYHDFFEAESRIIIADIGHYESEQFAKAVIYDLIQEKFPTFASFISGENTNPVHYF